MKKRILSLLLAVCIACSMLMLPASAASSNAAVQTAVTLGGLTNEQTASLSTPLTRGQLAKLLVAFSTYHESAASQGWTAAISCAPPRNMPPISALPSSRAGSAATPTALSGLTTA